MNRFSGRTGPRADAGRWIFPAVVVVTGAAGAAAAAAVDPIGLWVFILVLGGWVISLCLHEFAHALVALRGGDSSVRARGYLTLNPLRYTDVGMSLVIPIVLLAVGGIPLPGGAVLIEQHRLRSRAWASAVSLAGPATNLVLGVVLGYLSAGMDSPLGAGIAFLSLLMFVTALLNLLPVPGFDGFGALSPWLPPRVLAMVRPWQAWAPLLLFAVIISTPGSFSFLMDFGYRMLEVVGGDSTAAYIGSRLFRFWQ